jgi:gamma-glutamylcyclotransferase (GGCT)/AIG2-like uncharacterized protein YtfP
MHTDPELLALIAQANAARRRRTPTEHAPVSTAESEIERRYRANCRLAVYGSLAPGKLNHHIVAPAGGTWTAGVVTGAFSENGWGAAHGFPGLRWSPNGGTVRVSLLTSDALPNHWTRLDDFEGDDYMRILVPVSDEDSRVVTVANLYELR